MVKNLAAVQDMWVQSLGQEDLLEKYSCLENSLDRGAWWTAVRGMAELDTTERRTLSLFLRWILLTTWRLGHQSHTHAKTGEARNRKIESISWLPWSKRWERGQCLVILNVFLILSLILLCIILSVFFLLWGLKTRFWNLSRLASTLDVRAGTVCRSLLSLFSPLRKWQKMALWPHLIATFLLLFKSPLSSSLFYLHLFL